MFNIIKESFNITNKYIIIATPLILFSLISSLYLIFSGHGSPLALGFSVILFFLMLAAFLSGWFMMIEKAVEGPDSEQTLLSSFTAGVGEYFLPILGYLFNTIVISSALIIGVVLLGKNFIGNPGVTYPQIANALTSVEAMKSFILSLSEVQLLKINQWNMLLFAAMLFNYFIFMFYAPAMLFKKKNPFISLWYGLKDLFGRKFFKNIALFLLIFISYTILSVLSALAGSNIVVQFIMTIINFYYITYIAVLVFDYYYSNFAKIGSTIDKVV